MVYRLGQGRTQLERLLREFRCDWPPFLKCILGIVGRMMGVRPGETGVGLRKSRLRLYQLLVKRHCFAHLPLRHIGIGPQLDVIARRVVFLERRGIVRHPAALGGNRFNRDRLVAGAKARLDRDGYSLLHREQVIHGLLDCRIP